MFVTFYSYKGGVGRTLALVNVAYVLAHDRDEPCRVLIWDFDLEAPGITHLLLPTWKSSKLGFVDLVDTYISSAKLPALSSYIHKSQVDRIDILPAGFVDDAYSAKLERINWQVLYSQQRGYEFLEYVRNSIESIKPAYDYVLIDARTGYSDMGGVCLQQLPSLVVLMFRLNGQNLEGTAKAFSAIREFSKSNQKRLDIIPVISPAWPFATVEANEYVKKARLLFKPTRPLEISFDSALSFGERLIVKEWERYEIRPRAIDDYRRLANEIRQYNLTDALTMLRAARQKEEQGRLEEAYKIYCDLLRKKPTAWSYWSSWSGIVEKRPSEHSTEDALAFIEELLTLDPHIPSAYVARARLQWQKHDEVLKDLTIAIDQDPQFAPAYFNRGQKYMQKKMYRLALADLRAYADLLKVPSARTFPGVCNLLLEDFAAAAEDFRAVLQQNSKDIQARTNLALSLFSAFNFSEAKTECERVLELDPKAEQATLLRIHCLERLGSHQEAERALREFANQANPTPSKMLNVAEAFIALELPQEASKLLDNFTKMRRGFARFVAIANMLRILCGIFDLAKAEDDKVKTARPTNIRSRGMRDLRWRFTELRAFLLHPRPDSILAPSRRKEMLEVIEKYESLATAK